MQTKKFNPLSFLQSLWAGGLVVTFFMYLMFMTKHAWPIPTFDTLLPYLSGDNLLLKIVIVLSSLWVIFFIGVHFVTLIKHLKSFFKFKKTSEFEELRNSNEEISLMSIPLTLAMTMNAVFIVMALFIPWLRNVIEYVFPFAIGIFVLIWFYAMAIYGIYFKRIMLKWNFETDKNNNLSQLLAVFAFVMVGVWLAGPTAMSHHTSTSSVAMFFSIFFLTIWAILLLINLVSWFQAMLKHGINKEASPSLWILIPILTLFGISFVRHKLALVHVFDLGMNNMSMFILTSIIVSVQVLFLYLGYKVMKWNWYFKDYISGTKKSVGSFALICPWVAFFVFGMFFLNKGLVFSGLISKFSIIYFVVLAPLVLIQIKTIFVMMKLWKKLR